MMEIVDIIHGVAVNLGIGDMVWIHLVPKVYDGIDDPELEVLLGRRDYIRLGVDASEELIEKLLENGDCHIINKNLVTLKKGFKKKCLLRLY